jgi:hypothetical protein
MKDRFQMATAAQYDWVGKVFGVTFGTRGQAGGGDLMLDERLGDAKAQLAILVKAGDPAARELGARVVAVNKSVTGKSPDAAMAMDELENALMNAVKAMRMREVASLTNVSIDFRKLLIDWHAAQKAAEANIAALGDAYLNDDEVREDPRFHLVEEAISDLPTILPSFGDQLDTDINAILNHGGKSPEKLRAGLATLASYRAKLQGAAELAAVEKAARQDLGGDFRVFATLSEAIEKVEASLNKIAA